MFSFSFAESKSLPPYDVNSTPANTNKYEHQSLRKEYDISGTPSWRRDYTLIIGNPILPRLREAKMSRRKMIKVRTSAKTKDMRNFEETARYHSYVSRYP